MCWYGLNLCGSGCGLVVGIVNMVNLWVYIKAGNYLIILLTKILHHALINHLSLHPFPFPV